MSKSSTSDTAPESLGNGSGKPASPEPAGAPQGAPSMRILGQYLKDLSFENPHAPHSLGQQQPQPDVAISVNVNARNVGGNDFDVELQIAAKAMAQEKVTFMAELVYGGTFRLENFPQQMLHPAVLIECPRMLFPFARQILAEATRNGGFPPLMLDPIDFASMYQRRMQQQTVGQA